MTDCFPMVDLITVPVSDHCEKLRKTRRVLSERARRRNEQIALGYAKMSYLDRLEREQKRLLEHSKEKMPA